MQNIIEKLNLKIPVLKGENYILQIPQLRTTHVNVDNKHTTIDPAQLWIIVSTNLKISQISTSPQCRIVDIKSTIHIASSRLKTPPCNKICQLLLKLISSFTFTCRYVTALRLF